MPAPAPVRANTIKTRILIISDTHSASPTQYDDPSDQPFKHPLPNADILLHCGDLTMLGHLAEYERCLTMLSGIDAEVKLIIAGNHDISLDAAYYARAGRRMHRDEFDPEVPRKALEMWTGERAREAGVRYLEEGTHEFELRNCARLKVYASPYQPEFCDWAFAYARDQDRFNVPEHAAPDAESIAMNPIPSFEEQAVDIVMTHGPPMGILDKTLHGDHVGCAHLLRAAARSTPRLHAFGHIHEGWGAERVRWRESGCAREAVGRDVTAACVESVVSVQGQSAAEVRGRRAQYVDISGGRMEFGRETLMVNASIMDVGYRPRNAPWLVDLDLPLGA